MLDWAVRDRDQGSYNLTVHGGRLLAASQHDAARTDASLSALPRRPIALKVQLIHLPGLDRSLMCFE